ncbi:MAG: DUF4097 domain-containing protein [Candidatus Aminicenantes bacterium]|nr:DUF4097 domain-containing protein [Candidatus Aminicenantes bacterium]
MSARLIRIVSALLAAAASSACLIAVVDLSDPSGVRGWGEFQEVVPFPAGGTILFETGAGDVDILGWDRDEVEITARHSGRSLEPGYYWLGHLRWIDTPPQVFVDRFDDLLKIRAEDEEGVVFRIRVPHSVVLDSLRCRAGSVILADVYGRAVIDVRQGDVRVANYSGSLDISVGRGNADAELLDLRAGDDIKVTVAAGDIHVFLEEEVSALVDAGAPLGRVTSEFDLGQKLPATKVQGKIKDGQALISLAAAQGSITLKRIED